jgi:hypothetical protein
MEETRKAAAPKRANTPLGEVRKVFKKFDYDT